MRYLLSILLIFCFLSGFAQPISYRSNNQITVLDYNLFAGNSFKIPTYKDTIAANSAFTLDSCGKIIYTYTGNKVWVRGCNPKKWIEIVASNSNIPSFQTTLDNSSILTKNNLIETKGKRFLMDNDNGLPVRSRANFRLDTVANQLYLGNTTDTFAGFFQNWDNRNDINTNFSLKKGLFNSYMELRGDSLKIRCGTNSKFSQILMDSNGIKFTPPLDSVATSTLQQVTTAGNTTNKEMKIVNTDTTIIRLGRTNANEIGIQLYDSTTQSFLKLYKDGNNKFSYYSDGQVSANSGFSTNSSYGAIQTIAGNQFSAGLSSNLFQFYKIRDLPTYYQKGIKIYPGFSDTISTDNEYYLLAKNTNTTDTIATLANIRDSVNNKQNQLNGTGFVKASGTTISYDNSTYLTGSDTTSLSNRINTKLNSADTASLSNRINTKLNTSDSSIYFTKYRSDTMRTNIYATLNGKVNISDTANMLANYQRMSAFPIATFGAGSGADADTAAFTTTAIYGSFFNSPTDTIVVTSINSVNQGGSVSDTLYYNTSINLTGATRISSNTKIPPGNYVWLQTRAIATKPKYLSVTLIGYRKRP